MKTKEQIDFTEFLAIEKKLDIQIGQVISVEKVAKSDKMLKLGVIFGEAEEDEITVVTNIGTKFAPDDLLGVTFPFIVNLKPVKIMGIESQAMIMVTSYEDDIFLEFNRIGSQLL